MNSSLQTLKMQNNHLFLLQIEVFKLFNQFHSNTKSEWSTFCFSKKAWTWWRDVFDLFSYYWTFICCKWINNSWCTLEWQRTFNWSDRIKNLSFFRKDKGKMNDKKLYWSNLCFTSIWTSIHISSSFCLNRFSLLIPLRSYNICNLSKFQTTY